LALDTKPAAEIQVHALSGNWAASILAADICDMRSPKKEPTAVKLRAWRASLLRSRAHLLGIVYALDEKPANIAATTEFKIGHDARLGRITRLGCVIVRATARRRLRRAGESRRGRRHVLPDALGPRIVLGCGPAVTTAR